MDDDEAIKCGEQIGRKMATAYLNGDMVFLGSASRDLYSARMEIAKNPDSLTRRLLERDVNLGVNSELASRGLEKRMS